MRGLKLLTLSLLPVSLLLLGAVWGELLGQGVGSLPNGARFVEDNILYEVVAPYEARLISMLYVPPPTPCYRLAHVVYHEHVEYRLRNFSLLRETARSKIEIVDSIPGYTLRDLLDGCFQDTLWLGSGYIRSYKDFSKLQSLDAKNIVVSPLPPGVVNCDGVYYSADKHLLLYYGKRDGDYYQLPYQVDTVGLRAISHHATRPLIASDRLRHFRGYAEANPNGLYGKHFTLYAASACSYSQLDWDDAPSNSSNSKIELVLPKDVQIIGSGKQSPDGFYLTHAKGKPDETQLGIELRGQGAISLRKRTRGTTWDTDSVVYDASTSQSFHTGLSLQLRALPKPGQRFVAFLYLGDTIYQPLFHTAPWFEGTKLTAIFAPQGQQLVEGLDYRIVLGKLMRFSNPQGEHGLRYVPLGSETAIGPVAFQHGDSLLALDLPAQIAQLEPSALFNLRYLLLLRLRGKNVKLSPGSLTGCGALRALVLDNSVPPTPEQLRTYFAPTPVPSHLVVYLPHTSPYAVSPLPQDAQLLPESFTITNLEADKVDMQVKYRLLESSEWVQAPVAPQVALPILSEYKIHLAATDKYTASDRFELNGEIVCINTPYRLFGNVEVNPFYRDLYPLVYSKAAKGKGMLQFLDLQKQPLVPQNRAKAGSQILIVPRPGPFYQLDPTSIPGSPYNGDTLIFTVPQDGYDFAPQFVRPIYSVSTDDPTPEAHWNVQLNDALILAHSYNEVHAGDKIKVSLHVAKHRDLEAVSVNDDIFFDGRTSFEFTVDKDYDFQATTLQKQCLVGISDECSRYWTLETTSVPGTLHGIQRVPWGEELLMKPTQGASQLPATQLLLNGQPLAHTDAPLKVEESMDFTVRQVPHPVSLFIPVSQLYAPSIANMAPVSQGAYYVYTWQQIPKQPVAVALLHEPDVRVKEISLSDGSRCQGAQISLPMSKDLFLWPMLEQVSYQLHVISNRPGYLEVLTESGHRLQDKSTLYYGQQLDLVVHPQDGYRLVRLLVNGLLRPRQSQQFTVRRDVTIEAQFEKF